MLHELRYTIRGLRRNRGLTLAIVLCLALGIGATSAIFTVFNAALLKPLPFADADRLMMLNYTQRSPDGSVREYRVSPSNYEPWVEQNDVFEALTAIRELDVSLSGSGEPVYLWGARVMANFFPLLGVKPILGRTFSNDEDRIGNPAPVIVISHRLWLRSFGGEPSVVGTSVLVDNESVTVIGIMPPGFGFVEGLEQLPPRDVWMPIGLDPNRLPERNWFNLFVVGRLRPGVSHEQAQSQMDAIAERLVREFPETNTGSGVRLTPMRQALVGKEVDSALVLMLSAVGFLLLIACINVASMLLARASTRVSEIALRSALGSGRARLLRFILSESVVLALLGGGIGLFLAHFAVSPLVRLSGLNIPAFKDVAIDLPVLAFTLIVAVTTGILFGLVPALRLLDTDLREVLVEASSRIGGKRWSWRLQGGLVVGQIALVLVLLVAAGVMIRSFRQLDRIDPGFATANLLTVRLPFSPVQYPEQQQRVTFCQQILTEVRALPGVESSTVTLVLPIGDLEVGLIYSVRGRASAQPNEILVANGRVVGSDFFSTLNLPIVAGRPLTANDHAESPPVAVVSRHMAEQYWPDQNPLGRQVKRGRPDSEWPWMTVVGIAEDVRDVALGAEVGNTWYLPYSQHDTPWIRLVVRTTAEPMSLLPAVQKVIWSIDPQQPLSDVTTVAEMVSGSLAKERFSMVLLSLFAGLGLILAALGVYGVISYSINQRVAEFGIRMALGAQISQIRRMVLRQSAVLTASGLAIGIFFSIIANRLFAHLLFEIEPADPLTVGAMAIFLSATTLLATYIPSHRVTRIRPTELLKST